MTVIKITLPSGVQFVCDWSLEKIAKHYRAYRMKYPKENPVQGFPLLERIEMSEEEYRAIPASMESVEFFNQGEKGE